MSDSVQEKSSLHLIKGQLDSMVTFYENMMQNQVHQWTTISDILSLLYVVQALGAEVERLSLSTVQVLKP